MLAEWLAILHKKPAGTPLPWQRNEETFVLNGHPERPGSKFKPEWIYSYHPEVWPGYDPPEYVGTEGVRVNATHFAAFAREVFSSECE